MCRSVSVLVFYITHKLCVRVDYHRVATTKRQKKNTKRNLITNKSIELICYFSFNFQLMLTHSHPKLNYELWNGKQKALQKYFSFFWEKTIWLCILNYDFIISTSICLLMDTCVRKLQSCNRAHRNAFPIYSIAFNKWFDLHWCHCCRRRNEMLIEIIFEFIIELVLVYLCAFFYLTLYRNYKTTIPFLHHFML